MPDFEAWEATEPPPEALGGVEGTATSDAALLAELEAHLWLQVAYPVGGAPAAPSVLLRLPPLLESLIGVHGLLVRLLCLHTYLVSLFSPNLPLTRPSRS